MMDAMKIGVTPVGSPAGSASAVVSTPTQFLGEIEAVHISYDSAISSNSSAMAVKLSTQGRDSPSQQILNITGSVASGWYYPRAAVHSSAGSGILYAAGGQVVTDKLAIYDRLVLSVDHGEAITNEVVATILYRR